MYSNAYIFRYSIILVVLVAVVLSAAAMFLKPAQDHNIAVMKMRNILAAANIEADAGNAVDLYNKYIAEEQLINPEGDVIGIYKGGKLESGDIRAFDINLKEELYDKSKGKEYKLPVYIADVSGKKLYIIPMLGKGLWGTIYGNIALEEDMSTVGGSMFGHDKETPGLGAEIEQTPFEHQFIGKKIMDDNGNFVSIKVIKGGAKILEPAMQIHGVDAISGGTITSNGVSTMLESNLKNYIEFFNKHK